MEIENRSYTVWDFIRIPMSFAPVMTAVQIVHRLVNGLIPSLQILATARFVDTAIQIVGGQTAGAEIAQPLLWILLLISWQYVSFAMVNLARTKMEMGLTRAFRAAITKKCASLQYGHIENQATWDLIHRVAGDPAGKMDHGLHILLRMADRTLRVGSVLAILLTQVWWAALGILAFSVPLFILAVHSGRIQYDASKEAARHSRRAQYLKGVLTGRDNVEERTLFGYTDALNRRWYEAYLNAYRINFKAQRSRHVKMKGASLITLLVSIGIAGILLVPLRAGMMGIGMFMAVVTASFELVQMMSWELTYITSELANSREYLRDLTAFAGLAETPGALDMPARPVKTPRCIEFQNVSFAYPEPGVAVLRNFSLKLVSPKHYAIVGVNGAGKTTLTKLLTGLYDAYTGDILIDGRNLRSFTQAEIKAMFSMVYQDFAKYQIPMADSIGIGNAHGAAEADIQRAVRLLKLEEAVSGLPEGLRTPLGKIEEGGMDVSGGEWQRIAVARALVNPAPIQILDEPTAALDPVAESDLYALYHTVSRGKTAVFITHRLGAARLADEIVVLQDGGVAEQGTHSTLLSKNGLYAAMFEAQRGWYE